MSATTAGVEFEKRGKNTNMFLYCGKTINFEFTLSGDGPVDLTGYEATLQARDRHDNVLLELSTDNGGIIIDGPNGNLKFSASAEATALISKKGNYEVELVPPNGDVYRIASGLFVPVEEVVK